MVKGKFLINTLKKSDEKNGITLIITFSRRALVPFFFAAFENMQLPKKEIHLLIYDNTEDEPLRKGLEPLARKYALQFRSVRLFKSYLKGKGSISGSGNEQFSCSKLQNIWSMWLSLRRMIKTEFMFVLEDDTICPPNAFKRLLKILQRNSRVGFVTAIETGRNPYPWQPVRLGVHKVRMQGLKVLERHSLSPFLKGVVPIDASGVYCFAARTKAYLSGFEGYDPKKLRVPFFGLDNVFTYNIKQHGWQLLADFSLWCSHLQLSTSRIIAFSKDQAVEQYDLWVPKLHNYAQGIEAKKKGQRARRYQVRKFAPTFSLIDDEGEPELPSLS